MSRLTLKEQIELRNRAVPTSRSLWAYLFFSCIFMAIASSLWLAKSKLDPSFDRNIWLVATWFLWLLQAVAFPFYSLDVGFIAGQLGHRTHRADDPRKFWIGLAVWSTF